MSTNRKSQDTAIFQACLFTSSPTPDDVVITCSSDPPSGFDTYYTEFTNRKNPDRVQSNHKPIFIQPSTIETNPDFRTNPRRRPGSSTQCSYVDFPRRPKKFRIVKKSLIRPLLTMSRPHIGGPTIGGKPPFRVCILEAGSTRF